MLKLQLYKYKLNEGRFCTVNSARASTSKIQQEISCDFTFNFYLWQLLFNSTQISIIVKEKLVINANKKLIITWRSCQLPYLILYYIFCHANCMCVTHTHRCTDFTWQYKLHAPQDMQYKRRNIVTECSHCNCSSQLHTHTHTNANAVIVALGVTSK